jgi:hypothetical protein
MLTIIDLVHKFKLEAGHRSVTPMTKKERECDIQVNLRVTQF